MHHALAMVPIRPPPLSLISILRTNSTNVYLRTSSKLFCLFTPRVPHRRSFLAQVASSYLRQSKHASQTRNLLPSCSQPSYSRHSSTKKNQHDEASSKFGFLTERQYQNHPSKFRDLPVKQLRTIFGQAIEKSAGNNLLRTLQKQRVTGTLDENIDEPYATPELVAKGLTWLRANYTLDEDAAIEKRIEDESNQIEEEFIADAEKYKNWEPQQSAAEDGLYGKSQFEEFRKQNQERETARARQAEEIREAHGNTDFVSSAKGRAVLQNNRESSEWVKRYKERAALSQMLEPPEMSLTRRLLPSTLFTFGFLVLCYIFATNYKPPIREARMLPDAPPAGSTLLALIGINFAVFMLWRVPMLWRFMNKNALLIVAAPYPLSMLGNVLSHQSPSHLFINMLVLWIAGSRRESL